MDRGFFSDVFFKDVKDDILKFYTLNLNDENINSIIKEVSKENSVCMHIRGGDTLRGGKSLSFVDYRKRAIDLTNKLIKNPKYFIFSDSMDLAKKELSGLKDVTFINKLPLEDFFIMTKCGNNIIATSTFSWWAAYLNQTKNHLVIAPSGGPYKSGYSNPEGWISLE